MTFGRYALYYTPPAGAFASAGASWLGWDCVAGQNVGAADDAVTKRPRKYGFHGTMKPPFRLADGRSAQDLRDATAQFCAATSAVTLAGLAMSQIGRFIALTPQGEPHALVDLAAKVVREFDTFRAPLTNSELMRRQKPRMSAQEKDNLKRWGYPHVMAQFRFHMTLSGPLCDDVRDTIRTRAERHFDGLLPCPFKLNALTLVGEDEAGMFHVIDRFDLAG